MAATSREYSNFRVPSIHLHAYLQTTVLRRLLLFLMKGGLEPPKQNLRAPRMLFVTSFSGCKVQAYHDPGHEGGCNSGARCTRGLIKICLSQ